MNTPLLNANLDTLRAGIAFLESIRDVDYARVEPRVFKTTIGIHIRHIVDHYQSLLSGVAGGLADYQQRRRGCNVETSRRSGIQSLHQLIKALGGIDNAALLIQITVEAGEEELSTLPSSLQRELDMLLSHTIHHYALIAVVAGLSGLRVPKHFGVAPATRRGYATDTAVKHRELS